VPESPSLATPTARPSLRAAALAGLLAGLAAAGAAAAFDVLRAGDLARFLGPSGGSASLWAFLICLYGAVCLPLGLGLALLHGGLARLTTDRDERYQRSGPSLLSRVLGTVAALGIAGLLLRPAALFALQRFHHRGLLSLLLTGYGLLCCASLLAIAWLLLRALPRSAATENLPSPQRPTPPAGVTAGLALALFLPLGNEAVARVQAWPRLSLPGRAGAVAVLLPLIAGLSIGLVALAYRLFVRILGSHADPARSAPRPSLRIGWALSLLLPFCSLFGLLYRQREALRIVDLRPIYTLFLVAGIGFLGLWLLPRRLQNLRRSGLLIGLALPPLLWLGALQLGQREPLRKAALSLTPVAERIILSQALILDLDGDGVAGRLSIGGGDCDDWDGSRHPGAFDWPDNGIDENCNGHDATTRPPPATGDLPLPAALPSQPNIVLITIDALRADHVSVYGYPRATTPKLAELAADPDSVIFDSAWAHAPSTRYSVPAILSGRYPSTIVWGSPQVHWPPEVLPQNRLISEMLAERGYQTTALLSYHYFEPAWGLARGFADYDTHLMVLHSLGGDPAATSGSSARELSDLALSKLPTLLAAGRPFFLWVHYYDPHYRYEPHPLEAGETAFGDDEPDQYDNEIRYTDRHIGRLLAALRESPAWPKTTVLVTADHGEGFGEHAIPRDRRHGYHLYANQTRVPLIVRLAGLRAAFPGAPSRVSTPVGHVDLVPTILHSVLRAPPQATEKQLLGQSLLPLLAAPAAATKTDDDRVVFQEVMYEGPTVRKALVSSRWHLIQNLIPDGTTELYDLQNDPGETQDRAADSSLRQTREALSGRLSAWLDDSAVPADFAARVERYVTDSPPPTTQPLSARIGDCLEVVGSELSASHLRHGQSLQTTLVFRLRCRIPAGYRLFLHLRAGGGPFVNADHDFLDGIVPAQHLPVGRYVRDVTRLNVPMWFPAGPATLQVGLFHRNERLPVHGPDAQILARDRAVIAATVQVGS
jgi:arylsulfatase A-like enzyme